MLLRVQCPQTLDSQLFGVGEMAPLLTLRGFSMHRKQNRMASDSEYLRKVTKYALFRSQVSFCFQVEICCRRGYVLQPTNGVMDFTLDPDAPFLLPNHMPHRQYHKEQHFSHGNRLHAFDNSVQ